MHDPTIDEAADAIARGERVTVVIDVSIAKDLIAAHEQQSTWRRRTRPPRLSEALREAVADALKDSKAHSRLVAQRQAFAADQEIARKALETAAARKDRLSAAELERLRSEGYPRPDDAMTRTKNYYLSVEHARQMLPEPIPFELDSLFIRALGSYLAARAAGAEWTTCPAHYTRDEDSIGRLLWAAIRMATLAERRARGDDE